MKIHIFFGIKEGPWGGGNQFLKALRNEFQQTNVYEEDVEKADVILFNSFPFGEEWRIRKLFSLKRRGKIILHRIDGPISIIRDKDKEIDHLIYKINAVYSEGTIFQSQWSKEQNIRMGMPSSKYEAVIVNAPNPHVFNRKNKNEYKKDGKIRLIATSWSSNMRKGFEIYQYLDSHLDFSRYGMTFIGNSPINFKHIRMLSPMSSEDLAEQLKQADIYVTASQSDPCSNSLLEALHCGLPVVVLNDGGHPELMQHAGEVFDSKDDILQKIENVASQYQKYQSAISVQTLQDIAKQYYTFAHTIFTDRQKSAETHTVPTCKDVLSLMTSSLAWKIKSKICHIIQKIK